ncbi:MAG TPA: PRC-barrel domain-containing protein [Casimicrobiaceae bacterium]|nr:PRC-barrel domain-containing protein [Casimicrobiaceae bacterium]
MRKCTFRPRLLASLFIPVVAVALPAVAGSMNPSESAAGTDSQQNASNPNAWERGTHSMQSRLDRLWNALDTNGDGQISRAEFDAHRQLLAAALRPANARAVATYSRVAGQPLSHVQAIRASRLLGVDVTNPQGDDLGEIRDLLIDVHDGRVRYAVLDYGGISNVGDNLFAVPITAFRPTADGSGLVVDIDNDKLEHAPSFNRDQWPDFNSSDYTSRVDRYYASQGSSESQTSDAAQAKHEGAGPHASVALWRASRLIGRDVDNKQGDDVGKINDLVVNMRNGRVRYVLLQYDKPSSLDAERWALPIAALNFNDTHRDVVLNASPEQMDTSRALGNADVSGYPVAVEQYWLVLVPSANAASANAENNGAMASQPGTSSSEEGSPSASSNGTRGTGENASSSASEQGEANATSSAADNAATAVTQSSHDETAPSDANAQQNANRRLPAAGGGNGGNTENGAAGNGASNNGSSSNTSSGTSGGSASSNGTTDNGTIGASSNGTTDNGSSGASSTGTTDNASNSNESSTSDGNRGSVQ